MNKGFTFILGLTIGAAGGSVVTWKLLKTKYEQLAREEIEEVREYYATKDKPVEQSEEDDYDSDATDESSTELSKEELYTQYSSIASLYSKDNEGGVKPMRQEPYVISPAEFGEDDKYEAITLIYYNDGILADRDKNVIEDIESCIGYESLKHFGELTDDDSVYVRNDDTMMEYEVLLDESNYADLEGID